MRPLKFTLALFAIAALACAAPEAEDTGAVDTGSGGNENEVPDWEQTSSCADYLDCLEAVEPAAVSDAEEAYGEDGSCWGDDDDVARACDQACEDLLEGLLEDNPRERACGGEGGDTGTDTGSDTGNDTGNDTGEDTGSPGACPLDVGLWSFEHEWIDDGCGLGSSGLAEVEVECDRGEMSLSMDLADGLPMAITCTSDGRDFECVGVDTTFGLTIEYSGTANGTGTSASGSVSVEAPSLCLSRGNFSAAL